MTTGLLHVKRRLFGVGFTLCLFSGTSLAAPTLPYHIDTAVLEEMGKQGVVGVSIAVVSGDRIIYAKHRLWAECFRIIDWNALESKKLMDE